MSELSPSGWKTEPAESYCVNVADGTHDSPKRVDEGKPLVTSKNIIGGRLDLGNVYHISLDDFADINKRSKVDRYDVLLSMIGTVGEACLVEEEPDFAIKNVGLLKNNDEYKAKWLYFYLRSPAAQRQIKERLRGTTQQYLPLGEIRKFPISYPEKRSQLVGVVDILWVIHSKIALNRQINQNLEQIAQTIFKCWFVDFEPVKAKRHIRELGGNGEQTERAAQAVIAGAINLHELLTETDLDSLDQQLTQALSEKLAHQTPEQREQLATTASHFPDQLVESELGLIPEGWTISLLGDISSAIRRGISPKYVDEGGVAVINQKCIRDHTINFSLCKRNDPSARSIVGRKVRIGDVLVNSTGVGTLGRVAPIRYLDEETVVDSHVTVLRADTKRVGRGYFIQFILSKESLIEASGAGSTGQTELKKAVLEEIMLSLPSLSLQSSFDLMVARMNALHGKNEQNAKTLAAVRDALLPNLLSGRLRVGDQGELEKASA